MIPSPYQSDIYDAVENTNDSLLIEAVAGSGKEQPIWCQVQTPHGPKNIGDLQPGEPIHGVNGYTQYVVSVHPQGVNDYYKVTFRDGSHTFCGLTHLWTIDNAGKYGNKRKTLTLSDMLDRGITKSNGDSKFRIPLCEPVYYPKTNIKLHPYIVGLLIGDGNLTGNTPQLSFNSEDPDIITEIEKFHRNMKLNIRCTGGNGLQSTLTPLYKESSNSPNWIMEYIRELNLDIGSSDKFIPECYLRTSKLDRIELLRGLMDSDGSCFNNRTTFSTTSVELKLNVIELVQSLGGVAIETKPDKRSDVVCYNLNIKTQFCPFGRSRKRLSWKPSFKNGPSRYITNIEYMGKCEQICIKVSNPDQLYLTDNFIVTHNTTTIVNAVKLLPRRIRAIFVAFNKAIAEELGSRLPEHIESSTLHSVGLKAWRSHVGQVKIDAKKVYSIMDQDFICKELMTSEFTGMVRHKIKTLVGLMKNHGMVPGTVRDDGIMGLQPCEDEDIRALMSHYDIDFNLSKKGLTRYEYNQMVKEFDAKLFRIVRRILEVNIKHKTTVDFDDMLYFPVVCVANIQYPKYHVVMVDEAQDVSAIQRVILKNILRKDGRLIAVGDSCQPGSAMVKVVEDKKGKYHGGKLVDKPISELEVGDLVVSYDHNIRECLMGDEITGITRKPYSGMVVTVKTEGGLQSKYTANHICLADMSILKEKTLVYLMTKELDNGNIVARIGIVSGSYNGNSGLSARFRAEKADKAWIIGVFDYDNDALYHELLYQQMYNIPGMRFVDSSNSKQFPQHRIDDFWNDCGDMYPKIKMCLDSCGKLFNYPLYSTESNKASLKLSEIRACNLEDGFRVICKTDFNKRKTTISDREPILVSRRVEDIDVYSLNVDKNKTYIADGIITHNCQAIYGFRAASHTSMSDIAKDFNTKQLPLSICYRCPKSVIEVAKQYVPQIEAHEEAPEGEVADLGAYQRGSMEGFERGDYVICRNVAPLVRCAFALIAARKHCAIKGKDIGANIKSLIKSLKPSCIPELRQRLRDWEQNEKQKLLDDDPQANLSRIEERADSVRTFIDCSGANTVDEVVKSVDDMFSDKVEGAIMLSTIHKAKGLEADRVLFLDSQLIPSKYATQEWQKQQETNLLYVAVTRAKSYLGYVYTPDDKQKVEL